MKEITDDQDLNLDEIKDKIQKDISDGVEPFELAVLKQLSRSGYCNIPISANDYPPLHRFLVFKLVEKISPVGLVYDVVVPTNRVRLRNQNLDVFAKANIFDPILGSVEVASTLGNTQCSSNEVSLYSFEIGKKATKRGFRDIIPCAFFMKLDFETPALEQLQNINKFVKGVMAPRLRDKFGYANDIGRLELGLHIESNVLNFSLVQR